MRSRQEMVDRIKRRLGWAYHDLRWLTDDEATEKQRERSELLKSLSSKVNYRFKRKKIYLGRLSPGCMRCGQGTWSCLFVNGACTANCFFCPQNREIEEGDRPPSAEGIRFDDPDCYIKYLETFGFRGVGFSGGDPILAFDSLLSFIWAIRKKFGNRIYTWAYTNGHLIDAEKLKELKNAGIDELRFNICSVDYSLEKVELSKKYINTVTVEIPTVPEDFETLKVCLPEMKAIGVDHLNLHQLHATEHNYRNFADRNYTCLHQPGIPVLESELTALKLLKHAVDEDIRLAINYCSLIYRRDFQGRGKRFRLAPFVPKEDYEEITESGYIRRITVTCSRRNIQNIIKAFRGKNRRSELWSTDDTKTELSIHSSLLRFIDPSRCEVIVEYFDPILGDPSISFSDESVSSFLDDISTSRKPARPPVRLNPFMISIIFRLSPRKGAKSMATAACHDDIDRLRTIMPFERIETGLSDIY